MIRPFLAFWLLLSWSLPATVAAQSDIYKTYQEAVARQNWLGAKNLGNAIIRNYPGSEAAKKVAAELPEITQRAEKAQKELDAKRAREEAKRKKEEAERPKREAERQARQRKAIASLRKERDDVERLTFFFSPNTERGIANQWYLYLGLPDGGRPYLRFKWMYTADNWLFVKKITLSIDGDRTGTAPIDHFAVKRDNSGGRIWEWQDQPVRDADIPFFRRLAVSKKTIIRYEGDKYYNDRTLSAAEKRAFAQILDAYEGMLAKR